MYPHTQYTEPENSFEKQEQEYFNEEEQQYPYQSSDRVVSHSDGPSNRTDDYSEAPSYREQSEQVLSGEVSERVNTQILSCLIESETHNTQCLRALEERILKLEARRQPDWQIKSYEISTDSLNELTQRQN